MACLPTGIVKFWLTPGRGGFGLSPDECTEVGFYALATSEVCDAFFCFPMIDTHKLCTPSISALAINQTLDQIFDAITTFTHQVVPKMDKLDKLTGYKACLSAIPPNKGKLARVKSNNYLRNTLALVDAQEQGFDVVRVYSEHDACKTFFY